MLRRLSLLILSVMLVLVASAAERDALKLLTIGNSFSNDGTAYLPALAEAGGKRLIRGNASLGGCSLERHARHLGEAEAGDPKGAAYHTTDPRTGQKRPMTLPELLAAQPWDVVTIQQVSTRSFLPETYQPFADQLIAAIRRHAPTAEIVVHETWAYREDHVIFQKDDGFTPARMYAGARDTYRAFADGKGFRLIPSGDALHLARQTPRWTYVPDPAFDFENPPAGQLPDQRASLNVGWRWTKDKQGQPTLSLDASHLNVSGRYLAAAVWYQVLFETDSVPTGFTPEGLSAEDAADLRHHARAAVAAERARTASRVAAGRN
ncbi:MAG: DUF4886 domain-containing protein [Candidatus Didemnitutus sp.]|nr:DUF4886 domain-containing protein [Candidatus Didemnitutus sp.]